MSEQKKVDHWAFLASEIGAAVPEPEPSLEMSPFAEELPNVEESNRPEPEAVASAEDRQVEEPILAEPVVEVEKEVEKIEKKQEKPKASSAPREWPRSSWDMLANELGVELPPEPEPAVEAEPEALPTPVEEDATPPMVDRSVAERMFESLFSPAGSEPPAEEKPVSARESRPSPKREERRPVAKRQESRPSFREEEPRRGGRDRGPRRGGRVEEPRHGSISEPDELFLDEDLEVEEELETAFTPTAETAETAETEEKRKHRRSRRGRKDREKDSIEREPAKPVQGKAKPPVEDEDEDEFQFFDEPDEDEVPRAAKEEREEEEEERSGKRRRPRRGSRKSKKPFSESVEEKKPPEKAIDEFDDENELWEDDEFESHPVGHPRRKGARDEGRPAREERPVFRSIPTWDEAIGMIVAKNMESRGKRPGGQNRGGQNRGGRRDNRR